MTFIDKKYSIELIKLEDVAEVVDVVLKHFLKVNKLFGFANKI